MSHSCSFTNFIPTSFEITNKILVNISKIEAGQRRIDVIQLKEFAKAYKKPLDYFLKK